MSTLRYTIEPRDISPEKAARRMGLSLADFTDHLPRLLSRGFPASDPDTGNYDLDAIDEWRASRHIRLQRSQINAANTPSNVVMGRLEAMRSG